MTDDDAAKRYDVARAQVRRHVLFTETKINK